MAEVTVTRTVNAPLAEVWASWDAFGDIRKFNPHLRDSFLLPGSVATGPGAARQCDLSDGRNHIQERIVGYTPQKQIVIDIFGGTLPLKKAVATFDFEPIGNGETRVSMRMSFEPKMGLIGRLMLPMMKAKFAKTLDQLLAGNAAFVERGEAIQLVA